MSLIGNIRRAQVEAGERAVIDSMRQSGLLTEPRKRTSPVSLDERLLLRDLASTRDVLREARQMIADMNSAYGGEAADKLCKRIDMLLTPNVGVEPHSAARKDWK
jgi:hypothetical protein